MCVTHLFKNCKFQSNKINHHSDFKTYRQLFLVSVVLERSLYRPLHQSTNDVKYKISIIKQSLKSTIDHTLLLLFLHLLAAFGSFMFRATSFASETIGEIANRNVRISMISKHILNSNLQKQLTVL